MKRDWSDLRSLFLSDLHLGWRFSKPDQLLQLLKHVKPAYLYLIGDTFEWYHRQHRRSQFKSRKVVEALQALCENDTAIVILSGNHDAELAQHQIFTGWKVCSYTFHETCTGERLLIAHGDVFDLHRGDTPGFAEILAGHFYLALLGIGDAFAKVARTPVATHLCTQVKSQFESVNRHIADFEQFMLQLSASHNCSGVVCGHIHEPSAKRLPLGHYYNCGDWVENQSCICEWNDGRLTLEHLHNAE